MTPIEWGLLISAIIAATSTAVTIDASNKAADAQVDAQEKNYAAQQSQQDLKANQIATANQQAKTEQRKQTLREQARIRVSQSEGGISGLSLDRIMDISSMNEEANIEMLNRNTDARLAQNMAESLSMKTQAQGAINTATSQKKSGSMAALQIGTSALGSAASGYKG